MKKNKKFRNYFRRTVFGHRWTMSIFRLLKYFPEKTQKNAMVRNALNGFSKFSFMLTTFFDEFSFFPKKIYQLETFGIIWKQK